VYLQADDAAAVGVDRRLAFPPAPETSTSAPSRSLCAAMIAGRVALPISSSPSSSSFTFTGKSPCTASHASSAETAIHNGLLSSEAPRA